jgi:hypothetical protein
LKTYRLAAVCAAITVAGVVNPATAGRVPLRAQVGFATGQNTVTCANQDPLSCPRDLSAFTRPVWTALQQGHGALYFDLIYTVDFGPGATRTDALPILREANRLGITVIAWITAPVANGIYANENNAALYDAAVKAFYSWRASNHLRIPEALLDLEFPAGYQAVTDTINPAKLLAYRGPIDPVHQCNAIREYAGAIWWAHEHGLLLSGTPVPFAIDDLDNGDRALADELDLAPQIPQAYDRIYVQAYRTYSDTGPDYVAGYMQREQRYFGAAASQIFLGDTTMGPPYQSVDELVADIRLSVALGALHIGIFELASSAQKYGPSGIRTLLDAGRRPMSKAGVASAMTPTFMTQRTTDFFATLDEQASATSPAANAWPSGCPVSVTPLNSEASR